MQSKPKVLAVIPTHNSASYIGETLEALLREGERVELRVKVVDGGSKDGTLERVRAFPVEVIPLERNWGSVYPRNLALRGERVDYYLFVDSDAVAQPGVLLWAWGEGLTPG